jgi:hypothetical protein
LHSRYLTHLTPSADIPNPMAATGQKCRFQTEA